MKSNMKHIQSLLPLLDSLFSIKNEDKNNIKREVITIICIKLILKFPYLKSPVPKFLNCFKNPKPLLNLRLIKLLVKNPCLGNFGLLMDFSGSLRIQYFINSNPKDPGYIWFLTINPKLL